MEKMKNKFILHSKRKNPNFKNKITIKNSLNLSKQHKLLLFFGFLFLLISFYLCGRPNASTNIF